MSTCLTCAQKCTLDRGALEGVRILLFCAQVQNVFCSQLLQRSTYSKGCSWQNERKARISSTPRMRPGPDGARFTSGQPGAKKSVVPSSTSQPFAGQRYRARTVRCYWGFFWLCKEQKLQRSIRHSARVHIAIDARLVRLRLQYYSACASLATRMRKAIRKTSPKKWCQRMMAQARFKVRGRSDHSRLGQAARAQTLGLTID